LFRRGSFLFLGETFIYAASPITGMNIKVKYQEGVFKPLEAVRGVADGEEVEIHLEREDWTKLAANNPSFDFLKEEQDAYTEEDLKS
jgi:predicted DNA-binding antitoxin AbrB/MazE fold protein